MTAPAKITAYADFHGSNHRTYHYCDNGGQFEFERTDYVRGDLVQDLIDAVYQVGEAHPSVEALNLAENRLAKAVSEIEVLNIQEESSDE